MVVFVVSAHRVHLTATQASALDVRLTTDHTRATRRVTTAIHRVYFRDFFGLRTTPLPPLPLEVGPLNAVRRSGVWGGAPAEIGFCCILALKSDICWQQF